MIVDYKDVSFSFEDKRRKKRRKQLKGAVAAFVFLLVLVFLFHFRQANRIEKIQRLLLNNKIDQAVTVFEDNESSFFYKQTKKELKGLIHLFKNEESQAVKIFTELEGKSTAVIFKPFLDLFLDIAEYSKLKCYCDYLGERGEQILYYQLLYNTACFNYRQSQTDLANMPAEITDTKSKELQIVNGINSRLKSGKINYIFDINGIPIAYYDLKEKRTVSLIPGFDFRGFSQHFGKGIKFYNLTINSQIQKLVHRLFKGYNGSFILLNLRDNSMIVAYSKPIDRSVTNAVFSQQYEPGSVVKLLGLYGYLTSPEQELFPFICKGNEVFAGKIYYDWIKHGNIIDYQKSLALSCNIIYAQMAINSGIEKTLNIFEQFYFNSEDFKDLFLNFKTGRFEKEKIEGDLELAFMSVGLRYISLTTFHAGLISAVIAQNGKFYTPFIIKNIKNVLELASYNRNPEIKKQVDNNAVFTKMILAMKAVVEDSQGTGRRARVDFYNSAIKTGTAGNRRQGFDAVLTGFFPVKKPLYAFAFRLERGGKSEYRGALFLKEFLSEFYELTQK